MSEQSTAAATRVVLSVVPADERTAAALDSERYREFLRRTHAGPVCVGEKWAEFVSRGCGSTRDVTLCIESIDGGKAVGPETVFEFEPRSG